MFVDKLEYKANDVKMLQKTWPYVQTRMYCDGINNYVCFILPNITFHWLFYNNNFNVRYIDI